MIRAELIDLKLPDNYTIHEVGRGRLHGPLRNRPPVLLYSLASD